jgi:hypothetical protein
MSAAAAGLSRNPRTAMGGFHPPAIVAGGKTAALHQAGGAGRGAGRPGCHALRPRPRLVKPGLWVSLRRE